MQKEEKRLWEDFRHGMIIGTKEFVDRIRSKNILDNFHREIPQHLVLEKSVRSLRDSNPAQRCSYQCQRMGKGKLGNRPYKPWPVFNQKKQCQRKEQMIKTQEYMINSQSSAVAESSTRKTFLQKRQKFLPPKITFLPKRIFKQYGLAILSSVNI